MNNCTIVIGGIPSDFQKQETLIAILRKDQITPEIITFCEEFYVLDFDERQIKELLAELGKHYNIVQIIVND